VSPHAALCSDEEFFRGRVSNFNPSDRQIARASAALGVDSRADRNAVRRAFRSRAAAVHPDQHPELGPQPFAELQRANEIMTRVNELRGANG
jgi:hypothetical protein